MKQSKKFVGGILAFAIIFAFTALGCDLSGGYPPLTGSVSIPSFIKVGDVIKVNTDTLDGEGEISYKWETGTSRAENFNTIAGSTKDSYTAAAADYDKFLRVTVTREGFSGNISSNEVYVRALNATQPVVNNIFIYPITTDAARGTSLMLFAGIYGSSLDAEAGDYDVSWSLSGQSQASGTIIDANGGAAHLTIGVNETAESLTITVNSILDPTKSASVTIVVTPPEGKIITITGIPAKYNYYYAELTVRNDFDLNDLDAGIVAFSSYEPVIDGALTVTLYNEYAYEWIGGNFVEPGGWNDSGQYLISLVLEDDYDIDGFFYTNGSTFDINNITRYKYNIQDTVTTLAFNRFSSLLSGAYKISISGISLFTSGGAELILISLDDDEPYPVAIGITSVTGNLVTFNLMDIELLDNEYLPFAWNKSGDYILIMIIMDDENEGMYLFTDGQSFESLGIDDFDDDFDKIPKFSVSGSSYNLTLNQFIDVGLFMGGGSEEPLSPMPSFHFMPRVTEMK